MSDGRRHVISNPIGDDALAYRCGRSEVVGRDVVAAVETMGNMQPLTQAEARRLGYDCDACISCL